MSAVAVSLMALSCGEADDRANEPAAPTTRLEIIVWPEGRGGGGAGERSAVLTCNPPGGTHPDPEAACETLERNEDALAPVPADAICTQIFGGAQEASVTGTVRGREVDARFNRRNGCEIARWDALKALIEISPA